MEYKVWAPSEGASKRTPYNLRRDLVAFNTWSLNYAISELLLAFHNVDRQDIIILDRGPFDSLAWMGILKNQKKLSQEEYDIIRQYALHPNWMSKVSRVFLVTCTPDVSLKRENDSKLITRSGTAMNDTMLSSLLNEYKELSKTFAGSRIVPIDTTSDTSPVSTAFEIADHILSDLLGSPK
jgi:thymidylate kinase